MQSGFKFNLLPPKPQAELDIEVERGDSITYALLLVLFAVVVYLAINVVQLLIVNPRIISAESTIQTAKQQAASFDSLRQQYGELVVKTDTMESVLTKNIDTTSIFTVAAEMVSGMQGQASVISYSRESSGTFVFQVLTADFEVLSDVLAHTQQIEGVSDVYLRTSIADSAHQLIRNLIALNIGPI